MPKEGRNRLSDKIHCYKRSSTGVVPLVLGRADIVHIYKSRRRDDPLNNRPVSLTSVVAKLPERIVKKKKKKREKKEKK